MKKVSTYCRICEPQCALIAEVDEVKEQVLRLKPDKSHPIHKGFACHKGLNFVELHNDPDRNNFPVVRKASKSAAEPSFERLSWDSAANQIAQRITELTERHGADALGMYVGNPSAFNSTGREASRSFARSIGVKYAFGSGTQDCSNKFAASEAVFGTVNLHPIPDYAHTNYLLSIGSNPKISHASFVHMTNPMAALRGIVARGGQVKHINPRRIESATPATGDVLQIKPDTDVYFLAALIHEIHAAGLVDLTQLTQQADHADELWRFVAPYSAQAVADVVGVNASEIRDIALDFAQAEGAAVHMSTGANMGRQGTFAYWLVQMLSLITGNLGARGGNIYSPGYFPAATVGKPKTDNPFYDTEFGELRRIAGSLPGNLLVEHIEAGLVKGLVCMSGNPILSMGGETRLQAALKKLDLLIVIDIYSNATATYADYVLPATDWLERSDVNSLSLGFQPEPYVQYTDAVVPPKFERRPEWWIFARLMQAMGFPSLLDQDNANPMAKIDRQLESSNLSLTHLQSQQSNTVVLPLPSPDLLFELGVQREGSKVDCFPPLIERGVATCNDIFTQFQNEPADTLKLITLRTNYMVNSWMHNLPALKRDVALDNPLHMHPADTERLRLEDGTEVRVASAHGDIIATVIADQDLRPGVVAMTHGWGHGGNNRLHVASNHPGTNVNAILPTGPGSFDPLSNMSFMTGIPVTVALA
ncbi:MAG: molybdopterin-dependent oxidoreductase [bacterium]